MSLNSSLLYFIARMRFIAKKAQQRALQFDVDTFCQSTANITYLLLYLVGV